MENEVEPSAPEDEGTAVPASPDHRANAQAPLVEGEDYYCEGPAMVFTAQFLLRRGYCCESGCRHCPYSESEGREL